MGIEKLMSIWCIWGVRDEGEEGKSVYDKPVKREFMHGSCAHKSEMRGKENLGRAMSI